MLPVWPEWPSRLNTFLVEQLCERSFNSISLLVSWTGVCVPHSPVQLTTREPVSIVVSHICPDGFVLVLSEVIGACRLDSRSSPTGSITSRQRQGAAPMEEGHAKKPVQLSKRPNLAGDAPLDMASETV